MKFFHSSLEQAYNDLINDRLLKTIENNPIMDFNTDIGVVTVMEDNQINLYDRDGLIG